MPAAMSRVTAGGTGEVATRPRPEAVGGEAAGAQTKGGGEHPRPGFLHDLIREAQSLVRPAGCVTASTGALIGRYLSARQQDCLPAGCAQRCG